jgi:hypothetical protein
MDVKTGDGEHGEQISDRNDRRRFPIGHSQT